MYKNILQDIKNLDASQLYNKYKICVNEDGSVYDTIKKKLYSNLTQWSCNTIDKLRIVQL